MSEYRIDPITKEMATDYANEEAKIYNFKIGSTEWKKAFKEFVNDAIGTMSVGRNPQSRSSHTYKVKTEFYPDIFGAQGFAGRIAKNFYTESGQKGVPLESIQNRILSATNNLVRMFENGVMGTRNTTKGRTQGKIKNENMSELQFPNREEFSNQDEFDAAVKDVVYNWLVRDIINDAVLESLIPFFNMSADDVDDIMAASNLDQADIADAMKNGSDRLIKTLRSKVKPKISNVVYKKLVLR